MTENCVKCEQPKEPNRAKKYSYCLKCQRELCHISRIRNKKPFKKLPEKMKIQHMCRVAVYQAVKAGRLIRQPCEVCSIMPTEAHHPDYSKPLEVRWLCKKHHLEAHANRPKKGKAILKRLQPSQKELFHMEQSIIRQGLSEILAKQVNSYGQWELNIKPTLIPTRQKQVAREFQKRIQAMKIVIHALTPFYERIADVPTFVVRKEKKE